MTSINALHPPKDGDARAQQKVDRQSSEVTRAQQRPWGFAGYTEHLRHRKIGASSHVVDIGTSQKQDRGCEKLTHERARKKTGFASRTSGSTTGHLVARAGGAIKATSVDFSHEAVVRVYRSVVWVGGRQRSRENSSHARLPRAASSYELLTNST